MSTDAIYPGRASALAARRARFAVQLPSPCVAYPGAPCAQRHRGGIRRAKWEDQIIYIYHSTPGSQEVGAGGVSHVPGPQLVTEWRYWRQKATRR